MAKSQSDRVNEYHARFAEQLIAALEKGIAPWQKPWAPGERILPSNFSTGRSYRGGNAMHLVTVALERGYSDPRWGGFKQIDEAGGHVRKGEKGTPLMYVELDRRRIVRDGEGQPVLDKDGQPRIEMEKRGRPLVKVQYVWNVQQADGLALQPLAGPEPAWKGHERAEVVMRNSGVRIDHVAGDRAFYSVSQDRVVLPERGQFTSQESYTHTALHELGHASGHPDRLNRPTLTGRGAFGSEAYAREELRAEIAAMMTGERLGVGHEPRHGTAYVASWVKALQENPREVREACVDAQRASDWLVARERERVTEQEKGAPGPEADERESRARGGVQVAVPAMPEAREPARGREGDPVAGMSTELADTLRAMGARGYDLGYSAGAVPHGREPWSSARESVGEFAGERTAAGVELRFVLERAHATGYEVGYEDRLQGRSARVTTGSIGRAGGRGPRFSPVGAAARGAARAWRRRLRAGLRRGGRGQDGAAAGAGPAGRRAGSRCGIGPDARRADARVRARPRGGRERSDESGRGGEASQGRGLVLGGGPVRQAQPGAGGGGGGAERGPPAGGTGTGGRGAAGCRWSLSVMGDERDEEWRREVRAREKAARGRREGRRRWRSASCVSVWASGRTAWCPAP